MKRDCLMAGIFLAAVAWLPSGVFAQNARLTDDAYVSGIFSKNFGSAGTILVDRKNSSQRSIA